MTDKKLIALDLDGTTLNADGAVSTTVKQALRAARSAGHIAVFVTGRADPDMIPLEQEWQEVDYVILNNGAKVVRAADRAVLEHQLIAAKEVSQVVRFCLEKDLQLYLMSGLNCYVSKASRNLEQYAAAIGFTPQYFNNPEQLPIQAVDAMTVVGDTALISSLIKADGFALQAVVSEANCIDLLPLGINKWIGLQKLLNRLKLTAADVIAAGDYDNDLEMIRHAGTGVAVNNARAVVKQAADYITVNDHNHDAVADLIDQLVLKNKEGVCIRTRSGELV